MARTDNRFAWKAACVIRAQTIARDMRLLELSVDGLASDHGDTDHLRVLIGGATAVRSLANVDFRSGTMRVIVIRRGEHTDATRFLWSLRQGVPLQIALPVQAIEAQFERAAFAPAKRHITAKVSPAGSVVLQVGGISASRMAGGQPGNDNTGPEAGHMDGRMAERAKSSGLPI